MPDETRPTESPVPPARSSGRDDTVPAGSPPDDARAARSSVPPPSAQRYRLGAEIGRGGMGRVVEAFDVHLGRTVALKEVLPKGLGVARRFAREVQITARLEHASIVPLYDSGTTADGRPFYVMRKVTGQPLDDKISRAHDIGERLVLLPNVLAAIDAIAHAHKRGIIHRDLKPANILVGEHGETVVIDWGLAKVIGESEDDADDDPRVPSAADSLETQIGSVFGTPGFMPPEQARGDELGPYSDVFALGATLYQLLAGSPPVVGKSATEMIAATHERKVKPIAAAAPGTPPELAAIVDKALRYDAAERYPHAGALGEDVRRFLAGQLVAAHHYTRRERLARFAKRHRAVLSVVALASVVLAGLAWFSVHRVLTERDAAEQARADAVAARTIAERTSNQLDVERQGLVVENARNRVEDQPTHSVAMLKRIPASSPNAPLARGIASTAASRGVAWAMYAGDEQTTFADLDRDGRRLVQSTIGGTVRVYDLDTRRTIMTRAFDRFTRARWTARGKLLVTHRDRAPQLVDPDTAGGDALAVPSVMVLDGDDAGARFVAFDRDDNPQVLDIETRTLAPLGDRKAKAATMSPDGAYYAIADDRAVIVFDRDRREILRRDGGAILLAFSPRGHLAALAPDAHTLEEIDLRAKSPRWVTIPTDSKKIVLMIGYRGRALHVIANLEYFEWNGVDTVRHHRLAGGFTAAYATCWDDVFVIAELGAKLRYIAGAGTGTLDLPSPMPDVRIACRRGIPRLVAIGRGTMAVFDLSPVVPIEVSVDDGTLVAWLDDRTLLLRSQTRLMWQWFDAATRTFEPAAIDLAWFVPVWRDLEGGRILLNEARETTGKMTHMAIVTKRAVRSFDLPTGSFARLVPGDAIVLARGGRISARIGDDPEHDVAVLDGDVTSLAHNGHLAFAAASSTGELVRGSVTTGTVERARVDVAHGVQPTIAPHRDGRIYVGVDRDLYVWERDVARVAQMPKPISGLLACDGGIVAVFTDREMQFVATGDTTPHRLLPPAVSVPWTSDGWQRVATLEASGQLRVVELPSLAQWTMSPHTASASREISMSPDGRRIAQAGARGFLLWTAAPAPTDLHAQLGQLTNATIDNDRTLVWPWQIPAASHP